MSWFSEFAGGGGLGFLPSLLFDSGPRGNNGGSKRDAAPIPTGNPSYNSNLNAPANFWQGNQFQIPGAQGLGTGAIPPTMPKEAVRLIRPTSVIPGYTIAKTPATIAMRLKAIVQPHDSFALRSSSAR